MQIRKRFFTLTYCDSCHKILLQGLRCLVCGSRIHTRCIHKLHICTIVRRDFYRYLICCLLSDISCLCVVQLFVYVFIQETLPSPRFRAFMGVRCVFCHHRIREMYKRCVSCGNTYHNQCCIKAPVCSHPILQYGVNLLMISMFF